MLASLIIPNLAIDCPTACLGNVILSSCNRHFILRLCYYRNRMVVKNMQININSPRISTMLVGVDVAIKQAKYIAQIAQTNASIQAAQRLRAEVFSREYGVYFNHPQGLDIDNYDHFCQHINVYDTTNGRLIATTRLLSGEKAQLAGGFYSAQEFDLTKLLSKLDGRILEIGRTCVHPEYRSGAAITVLWSALAEYLLAEDFSYLIGCASIPLDQRGENFSAIVDSLDEEHFIAPEMRVNPKLAVPRTNVTTIATKVSMPPLLKAYLRMNAKIGGEACLDKDFNCADMFILLDVATLAGRYAQRFLKTA